MAADRKGESWAILAASEMGKGVWFKQWLKKSKPGRFLCWDRNDEYQDCAQKVLTLADLARSCAAERFALRYVPKARTGKTLQNEFEMFCLIAFECVGATICVEELADVTTASYAPPAWRQLNTRGRHHQGLHIVGHSQSPAWVDKAFIANSTFLHIGFLGTQSHRVSVAQEIDVHPDEIKKLAQFDFLEYHRASKLLTRGKVKLPPRRA